MAPKKKAEAIKAKPESSGPPYTKEIKPYAEKGPSGNPLYIVGLGGSAGDLEAFERFFQHLPASPQNPQKAAGVRK
jgi:hypothetical protein